MAKSTKKKPGKKPPPPGAAKKLAVKKRAVKKRAAKTLRALTQTKGRKLVKGADSSVLDRLWAVITTRRSADPTVSHSARLLSRGTAKIAQKFGEEAVECLIEASLGNAQALVAESADVLYHLIVMWVNAGIHPDEVWAELQRREGISGVAEKASRVARLSTSFGLRTRKIP